MTKQHPNDANDSVRQEESLSEDELFQKLTAKMETEVSDMPDVATRRGFLQKMAVASSVVPAAVLLMPMDTPKVEASGECTTDTCSVCQECVTDTCILCQECVLLGLCGHWRS
jgi:hypothetical protein